LICDKIKGRMVLFFVEKRKKNEEEMGEGRRGLSRGS
jgi:hypothetical protein